MKRWPTKPLGEICELVNGAPFKPSDWDGGGLPIIRIQNLNDGTKPFNYTSKKVAEKFRVRPGDTLLSWSGTPGTSFGCFRWGGPEGWLNQHIFNCYLSEDVLPSFFIHQVNSKLDELIGKAHGGVGLQHITKGALSSVLVTVPPLAEQERIVKLLNEADELRKLRVQADRRTTDLISALYHEMFSDPVTNPMGWPNEFLPNVTFFQEGPGILAKDFCTHGIPLVRLAGFRDGRATLNGCNYLDPKTVERKWAQFRLIEDDILILTSASFGNPVEVGPEIVGAIFYTGIIRFRPKTENLDRGFLKAYLGSNSFLQQAKSLATGAVISHFGPSHLKQIRLPIPPISLQKEFAQRVTEIHELEASQATSRTHFDALFQSMLHRAFSGEL